MPPKPIPEKTGTPKTPVDRTSRTRQKKVVDSLIQGATASADTDDNNTKCVCDALLDKKLNVSHVSDAACGFVCHVLLSLSRLMTY